MRYASNNAQGCPSPGQPCFFIIPTWWCRKNVVSLFFDMYIRCVKKPAFDPLKARF